jgi:hypothetical protein
MTHQSKSGLQLTGILKLKRQAAEQALSLAVRERERVQTALARIQSDLCRADGDDPHLAHQRAAFSYGHFDAALQRLGALKLELAAADEDRARAEEALKRLIYAEDRLVPPGTKRS